MLKTVGVLRGKSRHLALVAVVLFTLAWRLSIIHRFPDPDTDAIGHLGIARALLAHPTNVSIHWVYLPAYHVVLAALEAIGFSAIAIRTLNCVLAAFVPFLVLRYAKRVTVSKHVPIMTAFFCAASPLVNLLGTSAQQETMFVLLIVGVVFAIDTRRFALAGALLAIASLVRYEAWGAVALLVACRIGGPRRAGGAARFPFVVIVPSLVAIGAWLLAHKLADGQWFGFLRELYRYTHAQRESMHRDGTADLIWFPIRQPLFVFGWLVAVLFVIGLRRAWRASWVVPLGLYLFLQGAYFFKGALGSSRYYEALVPFVVIAAAHGVEVVAASRKWLASSMFAVAFVQLVTLCARTLPSAWPPQPRTHATTLTGSSRGKYSAHR